MFGLPVWALALVVAALTPFAARGWARWVERRAQERTARLLVRDRQIADAGSPVHE